MTQTVKERLLKVGLASAAPFTGEIFASIGEELGGLVLDHQAKNAAHGLRSQLLNGVQDHLDEFMKSDQVPRELVESIVPTVEQMLKNYGLRPAEWADVNYDPEQATALVMERSKKSLQLLDQDENALCKLFVQAFYAALHNDCDELQKAEPAFRRAVLKGLDSLPRKIARTSLMETQSAYRLAARALLVTPQCHWRQGVSPPAALLRADNNAVPFHGRENEKNEIELWCNDENDVGIRLYTGRGGIGKTRLLLQVCKHLERKNWRVGFLDHKAAFATPEIWSYVMHDKTPVFLVIDYAETLSDQLSSLFEEVYRSNGGHRIRIVMLARGAYDWWNALKSKSGDVGELLTGSATTCHALQPLAITRKDREISYKEAADSFSAILNMPSTSKIPDDIDEGHFQRVLFLHMSALASVEGVKVKGDQGLLDYLLHRERRFWTAQAKSKGLPEIILPGVAQAMAVITLGGGVETKKEAAAVLKKVPLLSDQPEIILSGVSDLLRQIYPGGRWIEPVLPDLLGEHLIQTELEHDTDVLLDLALSEIAT